MINSKKEVSYSLNIFFRFGINLKAKVAEMVKALVWKTRNSGSSPDLGT